MIDTKMTEKVIAYLAVTEKREREAGSNPRADVELGNIFSRVDFFDFLRRSVEKNSKMDDRWRRIEEIFKTFLSLRLRKGN